MVTLKLILTVIITDLQSVICNLGQWIARSVVFSLEQQHCWDLQQKTCQISLLYFCCVSILLTLWHLVYIQLKSHFVSGSETSHLTFFYIKKCVYASFCMFQCKKIDACLTSDWPTVSPLTTCWTFFKPSHGFLPSALQARNSLKTNLLSSLKTLFKALCCHICHTQTKTWQQ